MSRLVVWIVSVGGYKTDLRSAHVDKPSAEAAAAVLRGKKYIGQFPIEITRMFVQPPTQAQLVTHPGGPSDGSP